MSDENASMAQLGPPLETGVWKGWSSWTGVEPFENLAGPFYARRASDGALVTGFRLEPQHLNGGGAAHGGVLMTFADYSLFIIALDHVIGLNCVTVSLAAEFVGHAPVGSLLTCRGDVIKAGRSLIFVRGIIDGDGTPVLNFSGTIKVIRPRPTT